MTAKGSRLALAAIAMVYLWLPTAALTTQVGTLIDTNNPPDPVTVTDQAATQERAVLDTRVAELEKRAAAAETEAQKARAKEKDAWDRLQIARSNTQKEDTRIAVSNAGATQRTSAVNNDLQRAIQEAQDASAAHREAEALAQHQMEKKVEQAFASADAINNDARSASFQAGAYAQREADEAKLKELRQSLEDGAIAAKEGYEIKTKMSAFASKAGQDIGEVAAKYDPTSPAGLRVAEVLSEASFSTDTVNKLQDEINSTGAV